MTENCGVTRLAIDAAAVVGHAVAQDPRPTSALVPAEIRTGDLVQRLDVRRAGIVTRVEVSTDRVWIRHVSPKDRGYVIEERLFRAEWLELITEFQPWTDARLLGEEIPFVDYAGHPRVGRVVEVDDIFLRLSYKISNGDNRDLWVDRYVPQQPRAGRRSV